MPDLRARALTDLEAVAAQFDHPPTAREYNEEGDYTSALLTLECGSWEEALEAAGLSPEACPASPDANDLSLRAVNRQLDYAASEEDLKADLRRVAEAVGHPPTTTEYAEQGEYPVGPYCKRYNGWWGALIVADLKPTERPPIDAPDLPDDPTPEGGNHVADAELLADIQRVADEMGHPPTGKEYDHHGQHALSTPGNRFGSWPEALERAGLDPFDRPNARQFPYDDASLERLAEDIKKVADEMGRVPLAQEYAEQGEHSQSTLRTHFGSWEKALLTAGLDPDDRPDPDATSADPPEPAAQPDGEGALVATE
jgi:hypothetical protein